MVKKKIKGLWAWKSSVSAHKYDEEEIMRRMSEYAYRKKIIKLHKYITWHEEQIEKLEIKLEKLEQDIQK